MLTIEGTLSQGITVGGMGSLALCRSGKDTFTECRERNVAQRFANSGLADGDSVGKDLSVALRSILCTGSTHSSLRNSPTNPLIVMDH